MPVPSSSVVASPVIHYLMMSGCISSNFLSTRHAGAKLRTSSVVPDAALCLKPSSFPRFVGRTVSRWAFFSYRSLFHDWLPKAAHRAVGNRDIGYDLANVLFETILHLITMALMNTLTNLLVIISKARICSTERTSHDSYPAPLCLEIPSNTPVLMGRSTSSSLTKSLILCHSTQKVCIGAVRAFRRHHDAQGRIRRGLLNRRLLLDPRTPLIFV